MNDAIVRVFEQHMVTAKLSPVTIKDRMEVIGRLQAHLGPLPLLEVAAEDLTAWQHTVGHLAPATVNIYTRHVKAFYDWALLFDYITIDPTRRLTVPKVRRGVPHPTKPEELRLIFACARGHLRLAFVLAAFAGLRRGEICRLRWDDVDLDSPTPTALIFGKGGIERVVPLLPPVVTELKALESRRGYVVLRPDGRPLVPAGLSITTHYWFQSNGIETTLHSLRHAYATSAARITRDPLFVRDLLGHASVSTTEIYMQTSMVGAHDRLQAMSDSAEAILLNV
jgi:integrase/recombinase XerC